MELTRRDGQYFWTAWMGEQPFHTLLLAFLLLSVADLVATLQMIPFGVSEGNALAEMVLQRHGAPGMIVYKLLLMSVVGLATWTINRRHPRTASYLLWGGILIMAYITLLHLSIIALVAL